MSRLKAWRSRHDTLTDNKRALDFLADMSGQPRHEFATRIPPPPKKREKKAANPERTILANVLRSLRSHKSVAACWRMQSGIFQADDRIVKVGIVGMSDIIGMLVGGRLFAIEVKSENGAVTRQQRDFLDEIIYAGGIGGIARSSEEAIRIIEAAASGE